jgi:DEAD/DEAH box helicase domain-containing protein
VVFINPDDGPAQTAILLLKAALHRNLRTIVYTQSRKLTELLAMWAGTKSGPYADRISAYRAGLLPEERRDIERRLASGELLAVVSTSALELGIDIGDLDLCILVGYPGTIVSTLQRGGRVGRSGQDAGFILIAGEDALDQYFIKNPERLFDSAPEAAVVNPHNSHVLKRHIVCAAAELPLRIDDPLIADAAAKGLAESLEKTGEIFKSADGKTLYAKKKAPHREINLRGSDTRFTIIHRNTDAIKGEIDGYRVFRETHPGAIYLHRGDTYLVEGLDLDARVVKVSKAHVDYYTKVRGETDTDILDVFEEKTVGGITAAMGRMKVTDRVTGYEKWRIHGKKRLSLETLSLPPNIFETEGLWFKIPIDIQRRVEAASFDFLGGIHAMEHAAIGIFPLLVMADRNDLGGLATPFHPQVESAAVFIYDGVPGGAGLTGHAYQHADRLLEYTLGVVQQCPCDSGCPSCVHSPKCGSGNRPIDKAAGLFLLENLRHAPERVAPKPGGVKYAKRSSSGSKIISAEVPRVAIFDLETQRSAHDVGGWHRADQMGMSCAVVYDRVKKRFFEYFEAQVPRLISHLERFDVVVGFNVKQFDYKVLGGYSDFDFKRLQTLDILEEVKNVLGFRLSLDHLAQATLNVKKPADGLQALRWWQQGRTDEIIKYCTFDVKITNDLYEFGKEKGYLLFLDRDRKAMRIPVNW